MLESIAACGSFPRSVHVKYDRVHLFDDTLQVVLPRGHCLTRSGHEISLTGLAEETRVGDGPASAWFRIVRHTYRAAGSGPRVALPADDNMAVQAFAAAGLASRSSQAWPPCTCCRTSMSSPSASPRRCAASGRRDRMTRSAPGRPAP